MTRRDTFEALREKVTPENSVKVGYEATKDGIVLESPYGSIMISASKMEEMHAKMCKLQRQQGDNVIYMGRDR